MDQFMSEVDVIVFGEIISAEGFNCSYPISVHLYFDLPKGWSKKDSEDSHCETSTRASNVTKDGVAHFSHPFFNQFTWTAAAVRDGEGIELYQRPHLLFSVVGTNGKLLRDEGFAVETLPSSPGNYFLNLRTWKPAHLNITDKMKDLFVGIGPSLQDPRTILSTSDSQESHRMNLFGFETEPSGTLQIRIRVIHQSASGSGENTGDQLLLLERMSSSAGILRSVQAVIEAFQRARKEAAATNA